MAALCAAGIFAQTPAYADCTLSGDSLTLTCTGDLSGGDFSSSDTVTNIVFTGVTTDIGANGILFNGTGTADITFDTAAEPINIVLAPPATIPSATNRAGFNILTGGRIDGTLVGDVAGAIEADQTVDPSLFNLSPYGAIGLEAGTGINFTHDGAINVSRGDLRREDTSRADLTNGRFAALRTESDAGDVVVSNTGAITVQGGILTVETINTTGGSAGARSGQFSNGFSEVIGFMAQGYEALEYTQTGDITVNGGGVDVIATSDDNTADAQAGSTETIGIYVPAFNSIGGVITDGLPRFQVIDIIMNGDITVNGGASSVMATATGTSDGSSVMAVADGNDFRFEGDAGGVGVTGDDVDVEINGAINVTGGDMSATAIATPGAGGDGLVFVQSSAQDASGIGTFGAQNRLFVSGPINVTGGNAFGEATGTGPATTGTLYDDVFDFERVNGLQVRGGTAGGGFFAVSSGGVVDLTLNQPITGQGGDAHGIAHGSNYGASVFAGSANGFGIIFQADDPASYIFNTLVNTRGGDAVFEATGENITGFIGGGGASGVSVSASGSDFDVGGDITFVQSSDIEVTGGNATYTVAANNPDILARGGGATGFEATLIGGNAENHVLIDGTIRATGGNVTGTGDIDTALGGGVTGIFSFTGNGSNATIDLNGDVFAVAGQGEDGRGSAIGVQLLGPNTINVFGNINVDAANADNTDDPLDSTAFGIFGFDDSSQFRDTPGFNVTIDGGQVNVDAQRGIGIFTASETVDISIINGGELNVTGQDTTGIIINGLVDFNSGTFASAIANIVVGMGSAITSASGLAIYDQSVPDVTFNDMVNTEDSFNQTSVDNAGTITGTGGNSIDLGSGSDMLLNRATGTINGSVQMGDDADFVTLEIGSTINGDLDLGGGDDTINVSDNNAVSGTISLGDGDDIVVLDELNNIVALSGGAGNDAALFTAAAADNLSFDLGDFTFTEFETFIQEGMGILTVTANSNNIFNTYELRGGTLLVETDLGGVAANVAMGGTLGGSGTLGDVRIASGGTLSPGSSIGTLNLNSLFLEDGAILRFELGAPNVIGGTENDLVEVAGDLTLDGTLDIFAQPQFGDGVYRLFNYGGALTDNGLVVGMAPDGEYEVQTSIAGRISLIVGNVANLEFWDPTGAGDGAISGGSGVWNTPSTNWTNADGSVNGDFNNTMAVFMGDAGTITVEGTQSITSLQVATDGYIFETGTDGAISLDGAETFIRIDPGATATFDVPLVGDGRLVKRDTGTLVLSGTNTHAGGTEVREGVIEITSDDNLGAASAAFVFNGGTLRTAGALTLARDVFIDMLGGFLNDAGNDLTLSGSLSGNGELTKSGAGAWTLSGDSSGFMGQFQLAEGSLQLDGQLGGLLVAQAGTTLSGVGTAGTLDIFGTLATGNSIGTMTTTGDVTFRLGSDFQVELAADGTNDFLNVGGTATIEGGTLSIFTLDPDTSYSDGQAYTILSAARGLTGEFDDVIENSVFLDFNTDYQANDLVVTVEEVLTFPEVANTFNQAQISSSLMDLGQTAGSDSLAVYNALLMLDGDGARDAFDISSGEIYAGVVAGGQRQARAHSDKLLATARRTGPEGLGAWGNLSTQDGKVELDGNGADLDFDRQGIDLGIDYRGTDNGWMFGASAGWSKGDVSLTARNAAAQTDNWQIGAYGRIGQGREGASASAAITLGKGNADVARNISFSGINRTAQAETDTDTTALAADVRYGKILGTGNWVVGPVASVSYAKTDLDRFSETGADALNLSGNASTKASVYGVGAFANWQGQKGIIDASLQYGTGSLGQAKANLTLDGASNNPFLVRASDHKNDRAIFKVNGALNLGNDWSLSANARAEWAAKDTNLSAGLTARKTF